MAGAEVEGQGKGGIKDMFNTHTIRGRKNCTLATLGFYTSAFILYKLFSGKKQK